MNFLVIMLNRQGEVLVEDNNVKTFKDEKEAREFSALNGISFDAMDISVVSEAGVAKIERSILDLETLIIKNESGSICVEADFNEDEIEYIMGNDIKCYMNIIMDMEGRIFISGDKLKGHDW